MKRFILIIILIPSLTFAGFNQIQKVVMDPNPSYDNYDRKEIAFSQSLKSVAYPSKRENKVFVVVNGKTSSESYDCISTVTFLPETEKVAFLASKDGCKNLFWVVDGKEYSKYISSRGRAFTYSKRFNHFAYVASEENKEFVVIDGEPAKKRFDRIDFLSFLPDGERLIYKVKDKDYEYIVHNEKEQKKYKMIRDIRITPYSDIFYLATDGSTEFLVINGKEQAKFAGGVYSYCISPDTKKVITIANDRKNIVVTVDKKIQKFPLMNRSRPLFCTFAPDSSNYAFVAPDEKESEKTALYVNGKKIGCFEEILWSSNPRSIAFSTDSLKFAYVIKEKKKETLFINETRIVTYDKIYKVIFSPDSSHILYSYQDRDEQIGFSLGLDGKFHRNISSLSESVDGPLFEFDGSDRIRYIYEDNSGFYYIEEIVQ